MRRNVVHIFVISIFLSMFRLSTAMADKEPNNTIKTAEKLDEGSYTGIVYYGRTEDIDYYKVHVKEGERLNVTIFLLEEGYLQIYGYNTDAQSDQIFFEFLDGTRTSTSFEYGEEGEDRDVFIFIQGNGYYKVHIDKEGGSLINDLPNIDTGLIGLIFFIFFSILLVVLIIVFFIRVARTSREDLYIK